MIRSRTHAPRSSRTRSVTAVVRSLSCPSSSACVRTGEGAGGGCRRISWGTLTARDGTAALPPDFDAPMRLQLYLQQRLQRSPRKSSCVPCRGKEHPI
eukprot:1245037-Pleurochrysis_carterae.AAC.2